MARRKNPITRHVPIDYVEHAINELVDAGEMLERAMKAGLESEISAFERTRIRAIQAAVNEHIGALDDVFENIERRHQMR